MKVLWSSQPAHEILIIGLVKNAQVFLGSAELAAVCALLGKIPTVNEYQDITKNKINPYSDELYRYLQFDEIENFSLSK